MEKGDLGEPVRMMGPFLRRCTNRTFLHEYSHLVQVIDTYTNTVSKLLVFSGPSPWFL
ncbi:hypothetical protein Hanom_Chr09g00830461 [Helianthus anomalus]